MPFPEIKHIPIEVTSSALEQGGLCVTASAEDADIKPGRLPAVIRLGITIGTCFHCESLSQCAGGKVVPDYIRPDQVHIYSCVGFGLTEGTCPIATAQTIPIAVDPCVSETPTMVNVGPTTDPVCKEVPKTRKTSPIAAYYQGLARPRQGNDVSDTKKSGKGRDQLPLFGRPHAIVGSPPRRKK